MTSTLFKRMLLDGISSFKFILSGKPQQCFFESSPKFYTLLSRLKRKDHKAIKLNYFKKYSVFVFCKAVKLTISLIKILTDL